MQLVDNSNKFLTQLELDHKDAAVDTNREKEIAEWSATEIEGWAE